MYGIMINGKYSTTLPAAAALDWVARSERDHPGQTVRLFGPQFDTLFEGTSEGAVQFLAKEMMRVIVNGRTPVGLAS